MPRGRPEAYKFSGADLAVGDRCGLLTVTEVGLRNKPTPTQARLGKPGNFRVRARCDCGLEQEYDARSLVVGNTKSCGCKRGGISGRKWTSWPRTGHSKHPLYGAWANVRNRDRYGSTPPGLPEEWQDFHTFVRAVESELGPRPQGSSLLRLDMSKPYAPGNIRWAPRGSRK